MPEEKELRSLSKFLSLILRHRPEVIGLQLDENGWADVNDLVNKMQHQGSKINSEILQHIVETNSKKRFAFNEDHSRIRASQGHSLDVDLLLPEAQPPEILYHGTSEKSVESILNSGLQKRDRHHVHLSADIETARSVGSRYGKPKIFVVQAGTMHDDEIKFYLSENNVWLVDEVLPKYLSLMD